MWLTEVKVRVKRKNAILFTKDYSLLAPLLSLAEGANRRALILWALDLAEEITLQLEKSYPTDPRPRQALDAARAWATGYIKMPLARCAILDCHAMAKELDSPADAARCHAVAQACSVVHTSGHALGLPIYELTALVMEHGLDNCHDAVESRASHYVNLLRYWLEQEPQTELPWAGFLKK